MKLVDLRMNLYQEAALSLRQQEFFGDSCLKPQPKIISNQGFTTWDACTPRGWFSYRKGHIWG